jgi:GNAT superfamily N-acetyltransferase
MTRVQPLSRANLDDLAALFATDRICSNCWCMYFLRTSTEFGAGYGAGNRAGFAALLASTDAPLGVLAYRDGAPVGWCAAGPRQRYGRLSRSPLLKRPELAVEATVWTVPCFFVRKDARGAGVTADLLGGAVELAAAAGATAVEGLPLPEPGPHHNLSVYVGTQGMFAAAGFTVVARLSERRLLMRRRLR